ncbi:sugar ABC transporter substrate-binding protein [Nakamurella deserti]|uniref:sugar ABC transporter substrate-binding protein n=1 Tax=Nakamurella deserti TaxID=2164074 RepID=UPI00197B08FA|nr:maltose ABC transporter substrate-binding protein [Nakamurella deserti]
MKLRTMKAVAGAGVLAMVLAACGGSDTPAASTTSTPSTTAGSSASASGSTSGPATETSEAPAENTDSSAPPAIDENADLVIWTAQLESAAIQAAADKFAADNGITVSVQIVADGRTAFLNASQAGQAPDLINGAHDWIGQLVQNGAIDPVQLDEATQAKFNPLAIEGVTFNGQIYGVPYDLGNIFLIRNTDLAPEAPTSIEDMVATGKQLVADGKASEIMALPVGQNGDPYHMYPLFTSGGGYLFGQGANGDYDPKDLGLTKPEATAAMAKIGALGAEGALKTSIEPGNLVPFFTDKKTAYMVTGPWNLPDIKKSGVPFAISPVPGFEGGAEAKPFVTVDAMYVASKGKHKTVAEEFALNYFASDEVSEALYQLSPRQPALTSVYDKEVAADPVLADVAEAGKNGDILPAIPEMASVWDPFGKAQAAVIGGADPATTTEAAAQAIQAAIG